MRSLINYFRCMSLSKKILSLVAVLLIVMSAGVLYFIQYQTSEIMTENMEVVLGQAIETLRDDTRLEFKLENWDELETRAQEFLKHENLPNALIYFRNSDGLLKASAPQVSQQILEQNLPEVNKPYTFNFQNERVIAKELKVRSDDEDEELMGYVGLALSTAENGEKINGILWLSSGILALMGIFGLFTLYWIIQRYVVDPFQKKASAIADGNFSDKYHDDIVVGGQLGREFESMRKSLTELIVSINEAIQETTRTAEVVLESSEGLQNVANKQSDKMEEASSAVTELSQSIQNVAENTREAEETVVEAEDEAESGGRAVQNAIDQMEEIEENVLDTAQKVRALGESGEKIGKIVDVISQIAEQTSLLSLNAAIEAARAGEQGKGFAVVADEVSRLADRVGQSAEEIEELIDNIQNQTNESVKSMEKGTEKVNEGAEIVNEAGNNLDEIVESVTVASKKASNIASSMKEQAKASDEVAENVEAVNQASQEVVSRAQTLVQEGQNLEEVANNMEEALKRFDIDDHLKTNDK